MTPNLIPKIFRSSVDPSQVSLTVSSFGKAVAGLITVLGMLNVIDPMIATQAWGNFVAQVITAIPAGFAVWHAGQAVWGIMRKAGVNLLHLITEIKVMRKPLPPQTPPPAV